MESQPGTPADRNERRHPTERWPGDPRTPGQQDRDRLLYTLALRRLASVTQVAAPAERYLLHNRLTHTLEVAQIGRGIAQVLRDDPGNLARVDALGGLDLDVVEAAALAHDLGHPPFGHIAEQELDRLAVRAGVPDGFNGNAQSFRIITRRAMRWWPDYAGLNLTRATLNSVLKYPWLRAPSGERHDKWGIYSGDEETFRWARQALPAPPDQRSLEAELMDWADDIAYSVHDLEDFYCAGLIPLDRLTSRDREEFRRFADGAWQRLEGRASFTRADLEQVAQEFFNFLPAVEEYRGLRVQRAALREMTSFLVNRYIRALSLAPVGAPGPWVRIADLERREVTILKQLTWQYVISRPALATQQYGQRRVIRFLFRTFERATRPGGDRNLLPESYREELDDARTEEERIRLVVDLIASMTEQQALDMYRRLTGINLGSVLDASGL